MKKKICLLFVIFLVLISYFLFNKNSLSSKEELINISKLDEDYMDEYFQDIKDYSSEEDKENMLIVISSNKISNDYGAKKVIEAPNNQYILVFDSSDKKDEAFIKLQNNKDITSVEENIKYELHDYNSWGIESMGLDIPINNGNSSLLEDVTVAIIDTGLDVDLFNKYYNGRLAGYYNTVISSNTIMSDQRGHGTHIAGTIAEGTPSNVKIFPLKAYSGDSFSSTDIVASINYVTYNKIADVINMSFGSYNKSNAIEQAIIAAKNENIISVVSAGNDNTSNKSYPAAYDSTISIASIDSQLQKSSFSNYGDTITFAAPGSDIKSIMSKNASIAIQYGNNDDDDHEIISGTSMAAPHASAAVAVLKSYNKNLTFANVMELLKRSVLDLGIEGWDKYYGYGMISFNDKSFCDGNNCDEFGVFKENSLDITNIEVKELRFTGYNYYSITNLLNSLITVYYDNSTTKDILLGELPDLEILNYDPESTQQQSITIKTGDISVNTIISNPSNYENGWEYNEINNELEITGYKSHSLDIKKLYVPRFINSKQVVSFADGIKLKDLSNDFLSYEYMYLPSGFNKIGSDNFYRTSIKYIDGDSSSISIGNNSFEESTIINVKIPITSIGNSAFKNCFSLKKVVLTGTNLDIGEYAFYNDVSLTEIDKPTNYPVQRDIIGKYAFYNCFSLELLDITLTEEINEYAFYQNSNLHEIDIDLVEMIGNYAFYDSGLYDLKLNLSTAEVTVGESAFQLNRYLESVSFNKASIESKAFYNSGVEKITVGKDVQFISDDAFAYSPINTVTGTADSTSIYRATKFGIIENSSNKLIVGSASKNIELYDHGDYTKVGDYAFTGNLDLEKIVLSSDVIEIGIHSFEDCIFLSDVYILNTSIQFGNNSFDKPHAYLFDGEELNFFVYRNSSAKQLVVSKGYKYNNIDPDEVIVNNPKTKYKNDERVDLNSISVKLIYHEEEDREEVLSISSITGKGPVSRNVGYDISYPDDGYKFKYGDTYYDVKAYNSLGYLSVKRMPVEIEKLTPTYTVPTGLTASIGQALSEIVLPSGFSWMDDTQIINFAGDLVFKARYTPDDTDMYEIIDDIDITISVINNKTEIIPNIIVYDKVYDGTSEISFNITNLDSTDYTVVSTSISNISVGRRTAMIRIRLTDDKFNNYSLEDGRQENEYNINFNITKANLYVIDSSKNVTVLYDGKEHTIEVNLQYNQGTKVRYMNSNEQYVLSEVPKYIEVGTYVIKYKLYIDDNYNEYYGERTLTINSNFTYSINKYDVDETNSYISKVMVNTTVDSFKSNIELGTGYTVEVDYKTIDNRKVIYTGGKTRIKKDSIVVKEYTNVVIGDINGDGAINSADLLKIRQHLLGSITLSGAYFLSSDINYDYSINSADLLRVRQHLLGSKPIV